MSLQAYIGVGNNVDKIDCSIPLHVTAISSYLRPLIILTENHFNLFISYTICCTSSYDFPEHFLFLLSI